MRTIFLYFLNFFDNLILDWYLSIRSRIDRLQSYPFIVNPFIVVYQMAVDLFILDLEDHAHEILALLRDFLRTNCNILTRYFPLDNVVLRRIWSFTFLDEKILNLKFFGKLWTIIFKMLLGKRWLNIKLTLSTFHVTHLRIRTLLQQLI